MQRHCRAAPTYHTRSTGQNHYFPPCPHHAPHHPRRYHNLHPEYNHRLRRRTLQNNKHNLELHPESQPRDDAGNEAARDEDAGQEGSQQEGIGT